MDTIRRLSFSALPESVRCIWAKSSDTEGHGLLAHLLDVAAVTEAIVRLEPPATRRSAARAFGLRDDDVPRWLATLAGLHDFGKAIAGFQAKWPEGRQRDEQAGLAFETATLKCDQHSLATAALLVPALLRLSGAGAPWCRHVVQAISAHHGYHFLPVEVGNGKPRFEAAAWGLARETLIDVYWAVLAPQGRPSTDGLDLPMVNWLAGLTSAADWIASNPAWFALGERCDDLPAYYQGALQLADQALREIGWRPWQPLQNQSAEVHALLQRIVQRPAVQARPLQCVGDQMLQDAREPSLLLVEAPMGEGKTELAFLAHLRLQAANQHRGLYVALPTQATSNALFQRTATFLRAFASGAQGALDLQLAHGGAAMNQDLAALRDIDHSTDATLAASAWFGQRRRPLLSPYGVGTVDQALYAVLNVKHHFVRLWGLSNRVVVLDEVHAYDTYTNGLITNLLRWLKALGCSVVLMSATLPHARCRELLAAWGVDQAPPELAYPRLMLADDVGVRGAHVAARPLAPIALGGLGSDLAALAQAAIAAVADGGCGALIVNTVSRAQALYRALQAGLAQAGLAGHTLLLLFHARFPADDRALLEQRVLSLFGSGGQRPQQALLVATQVAEQSLDIDFDFMFSDLAPVDLLLQRAGRLHRHSRERPPAHAQARLLVAGLLPGQWPDLKGTAWGFVYEPYILGRTWALLTQESVLTLPQDIDRLVQAVYDMGHPLPEGLDAAVLERIEIADLGEYLGLLKTQRQMASNVAIDPADEAHRAYDSKPRGHEEDETGLGLQNTTRLGEPSITLIPVIVGAEGRWHVHEGDAGFAPDRPVDAATARVLYNRQLKVSRKRVVRHFERQPPPPAFAEHALLRHAHALLLVAGRATDGDLKLSLDPELGLVHDDGVPMGEPLQGTST